MKFKINSDSQKHFQQVGGLLKNVNKEYTNFVSAFVDKNNMDYHVVFDLGNNNQIKSYSGDYEIYVIVADLLLKENI